MIGYLPPFWALKCLYLLALGRAYLRHHDQVNTLPSFYYHDYKRNGAFPVAVYVLQKLLADHPSLYRMSIPRLSGWIYKGQNSC